MNSLFISYSRGDMIPVHWLDRLTLYLAPLRQQRVEFWDDSRIKPGSLWREEIARALESSTASILLVGPAFLASEFIQAQELPRLLPAANRRGTRIYPLVVAYCAYRQSVLEPYQAFNDPDTPLEALLPAQQNKVLNDISMAVDSDLRHASRPPPLQEPSNQEVISGALRQLALYVNDTGKAFMAQCNRRDILYKSLRERLKVREELEYENFFFRFYAKMNDEEKFQFLQIRALTEGPLHDGNAAILRVMESNPQVLDQVPSLLDLRQHIVFWLNKYDKVFSPHPEMCVLYTGVEDGVPFPQHAEQDVAKWLSRNR